MTVILIPKKNNNIYLCKFMSKSVLNIIITILLPILTIFPIFAKINTVTH